MNKSLDIKKSQMILKEIAMQFHKICVDNNIPYYMIGGTMLGAIRHKGFIPWDDDMDFGVPGKYYSKLIKALKENLPDNMRLLTIDNSEYVISGYVKIEDHRTVITDPWYQNYSGHCGLNIDVFPLDYGAEDYTKTKKQLKLIQKYTRICEYKYLNIKERAFAYMLIALFVKIFYPLNKQKLISKSKSIILENSSESMYMLNYFGRWGEKEIMNIEYWGEPLLYKYEDIELFGVAKPDLFLKQLYGDFMKRPPKEQQLTHTTKVLWK